mmetsp:Transcript_19521/g.38798  ORF Transcript_19521/g.38798 Transcript_19521/m.38798 type:complete len:134 (+) Transcript_19521:1012-1413(+)
MVKLWYEYSEINDFLTRAHLIFLLLRTVYSFLCPGLPLHRCRELGFDNRLFELMNERALTKGEIQQFCSILFGGDELDGVPDPYEDFDGFLSNIDRIMESSDLNQFNPITKKIEPWINTKRLRGELDCFCTVS